MSDSGSLNFGTSTWDVCVSTVTNVAFGCVTVGGDEIIVVSVFSIDEFVISYAFDSLTVLLNIITDEIPVWVSVDNSTLSPFSKTIFVIVIHGETISSSVTIEETVIVLSKFKAIDSTNATLSSVGISVSRVIVYDVLFWTFVPVFSVIISRSSSSDTVVSLCFKVIFNELGGSGSGV